MASSFGSVLLVGSDTQSITFVGLSVAEDFSMTTMQLTWIITGSTVAMTIGRWHWDRSEIVSGGSEHSVSR